ncbi:hypothetical protein OH76DRAFT_1490493 [Lentinus brumalis]|uniref:Uncharacterized protein n=1 Tax=Lentinus brumalis TaxID=2498619 RepID=A0A371CIT3_9APHY|nr:hypothetical protein OH76DRAFT_1490493 [Polyporus brumalis]
MPPAYTVYSTPAPTAPFSESYFQTLSFRDAEQVQYPAVLPAGSVVYFEFTKSEFTSEDSDAVLVQPDEFVPSWEDLAPVMRVLEDQYKEGMRSIIMTLRQQDAVPSHRTAIYGFSKLRLFVHINNFRNAVQSSAALLRCLPGIHVPGEIIDFVSASPILSPLSGFVSAARPLWTISDLLGEAWIEEDIINLAAELFYFQQALRTFPLSEPTFLFLPTFLYNDILLLLRSPAPAFTPNIRALRARLTGTVIRRVALLVCKNNHYVAYIYDGSPVLSHGDSMGGEPHREVLEVLSWLLEGLPYSRPTAFTSVEVPRQRWDAGSGSCAVAAYNFVVSRVDARIPYWQPEFSQDFRNDLLRDFILYHFCASHAETHHMDWTEHCVPGDKLQVATALEGLPGFPTAPSASDSWADFCGFEDFNLSRPSRTHPVRAFLHKKATLPSLLPADPKPAPLLPSPEIHVAFPSLARPVSGLSKQQFPLISQLETVKFEDLPKLSSRTSSSRSHVLKISVPLPRVTVAGIETSTAQEAIQISSDSDHDVQEIEPPHSSAASAPIHAAAVQGP